MTHPDHDKSKSRGASPDMSPEAIAHRLEIVSHLREVCLWLGTAKKVEATGESQPPDPPKPLGE
jgi:hypothetical protein